MTDRELLALAAKAAGVEVVTPMMIEWDAWNPLDDDGDALRLAVKLRMNIDLVLGADVVEVFINEKICHFGIDITNPDYEAATRRAIVRAAAEIGRAS